MPHPVFLECAPRKQSLTLPVSSRREAENWLPRLTPDEIVSRRGAPSRRRGARSLHALRGLDDFGVGGKCEAGVLKELVRGRQLEKSDPSVD